MFLERLEARCLLHPGHSDGVIRLEAGGDTHLDRGGHVWVADTAYAGGREARKPIAVRGTDEDALYSTYRWGRRFGYSIPIDDGTYYVRFYFTEPTAKPGRRVFNVFAEGRLRLSNVDVSRQRGTRRAMMRGFDVAVGDERLNLTFKASTGKALVSAIEIIPIYSPDPPNPPEEPPSPPEGGLPIPLKWDLVSPSPIPRAESLGGVAQGKVFVLGGFSGDLGPVTRSDVYDPTTNEWTQIADLPTRLTHAGTAISGRHIYVAGGYTGIGGGGYAQTFAVRDVWHYSIDENKWYALAPLPEARGSGALVALGTELHFFGGVDSTRADRGEHWVLNLAGGSDWRSAAPLPNPRSHMGYVEVGGLIYAIGGQHDTDEDLVTQPSVHAYDAKTDRWTLRANLPRAISHISSSTFVWRGRIVTMGGELAHGVSISEMFVYDPAQNAWNSLTPMPFARNSGVAGVVGDDVYYIGGGSAAAYKGTAAKQEQPGFVE